MQRPQIARSSVPGQRPPDLSRPTGELYVNFPDRQLGVVRPDGGAQDLIAVPFHNDAASYGEGAIVRRGSQILRALEDIAAGTPFDPDSWTDLEGGIPVSAVEPPGPTPNTLWVDISATDPEIRVFDADAGWLPLLSGYLARSGGTMTGPLQLPGSGDTLADPALSIGRETDGLSFSTDGLRVIVGGVIVGRTYHADAAPETTNGDNVLPTRLQGDARWLRQAGGTLTGSLTLADEAPTQARHAASKGYVDGKAGGAVLAVEAPTAIEGGFWLKTDNGELWVHNGTTWVAAGGTTKVSKAGDTMTGHLNVPPGAAEAQVPRASEVLLKAGGTATGKITLAKAEGVEIPQLTAGVAQIMGTGGPANGIRIRFGGTGGAGGALALTSGDAAWMSFTPSTQSLATSTRQLEVVGSLRASEEITLHSELSFTRTGGPAYVNWSADNLTFRRGGTAVAVIGAGGTAAPLATTLMTREKGDEHYLRRTGTSPAAMAVNLNMGGSDIVFANRLTFTAAGAGAEDYLTWVTGSGLQGFDAGTLAFELGPSAARLVGVYADTDVSGANVHVTATGQLRRSTSSAATKTAILPLGARDVRGIIERLRPVTFASRQDPDGHVFAGFIAEQVARAFPMAAQDGGKNYDVRAIVAALVEAMTQVFDRLDRIEPDGKEGRA